MKNRAQRPSKHMLAHQIAYVERDLAVVFDGAFAFRTGNTGFGSCSPTSTCCHHAGSGADLFSLLLRATDMPQRVIPDMDSTSRRFRRPKLAGQGLQPAALRR